MSDTKNTNIDNKINNNKTNKISNSKVNFISLCIELINKLIESKEKINKYYKIQKKNQELTGNTFKIRSYQKWKQKLNLLENNELFLNNEITIHLIKKLEFSSSLEKKIIEIFETKTLKDLNEDLKLIEQLEKECKNSNKNTNQNSKDGDEDIIISSINEHNKLKKDKFNIQDKVTKINTSSIEGIPKQLINLDRPKDECGGAIYDLKLVTGIGPRNAEKFVNDGITLEVLLHDWNQYVEKDKNNSILMINKINKPSNYTDIEWNKYSHEKQHDLKLRLLRNKLENETNYLNKLTHHQLIGIKYFYDILKRIPRDEIKATETFLKRVIKRINPELELTVCGSYRRGKNNSGDIDSLITHPKIKTMEQFNNTELDILGTFVKQLEMMGYLIDHLTEFSKTKYMGLGLYTKKSKIARRIDIRFVPYNSYGAAILYFTGSKNFNTDMRKHAISKGYTLNEYGLYKKNGSEKILTECSNEEDIFKHLNYTYVKPTDRDI